MIYRVAKTVALLTIVCFMLRCGKSNNTDHSLKNHKRVVDRGNIESNNSSITVQKKLYNNSNNEFLNIDDVADSLPNNKISEIADQDGRLQEKIIKNSEGIPIRRLLYDYEGGDLVAIKDMDLIQNLLATKLYNYNEKSELKQVRNISYDKYISVLNIEGFEIDGIHKIYFGIQIDPNGNVLKYRGNPYDVDIK